MAVRISELGGISPFEVGDRSTLGFRWKRWIRSFELFAEGRGVTEAAQKKELLLHLAGMEVQDIVFTLECPDSWEGQTVYSVAKGC